MKKSIFSILALMLSMSMLFGACSSGSDSGEASLPTPDSPVEGAEEAPPADAGTDDATAETTTGGAADQKIIWAVHSEADTLDPGISNNTFASPILMNVFEGLMTYDENNNLVTGVAESYELSEDGTKYTFTLKDGLKWSDGSDLTAEDFIYSWTRVITPATASNFSSLITDYVKNSKEFFDVDNTEVTDIADVGFRAIDEKTIEIETYSPTPYFLDILSTYTWAPVKKDVVEANPTA